MLKYKDKVKIISGFYEGLVGTVVGTNNSQEDGYGISLYANYTIEMDETCHNNFTITIGASRLEKIEG